MRHLARKGDTVMEIVLVALGSLVFGFLLATLFLRPLLKARFDAEVAESVRKSRDQMLRTR